MSPESSDQNSFETPASVTDTPAAFATMLCGRAALITRSRHVVHCQSILRTQTGPLHSKPELIFEHAELLAVNKPPGIPFHSTDHVLGLIPSLRCMETEGLLPHLGPLYPLHRSSPAQLSLSTSSMLPTTSCMHGLCGLGHAVHMP